MEPTPSIPTGARSNRRSRQTSVDTGNRFRDRHLRSADFFDGEAHPHVRFTANDIVDLGNGTLDVTGVLEAAGKRVPLAFDTASRELGQELEATTSVDHQMLGMTHSPLGMLRHEHASTRGKSHTDVRLTTR
jgi:polyisoprenoid-binding protein YceI